MGVIRRNKVATDIEERVVIGLVVSEEYCKEITPIVDYTYFTSSYLGRVAKWATEYYLEYRNPAKNMVQEIFRSERQNLKTEEAELIGSLLERLSGKYEEEGFNAGYLVKRTIPFFKERAVKSTAERALALAQSGNPNEAEAIIEDYKRVAVRLSSWVNPFSVMNVRKSLIDDDSDYLFSLPGGLEKLIGGLHRGWLFAVLGPMKRGKSWWLNEFAVCGIMSKFNVAVISLEMDARRVSKRLYKRFTGFGDIEKDFVYPVFDCRLNQTGECSNSRRVNHKRLLVNGEKPEFNINIKYKPCTVCRGKIGFVVDTWFTYHRRQKAGVKNVSATMKSFAKYTSKIRVISYPAYSANISTIKSDLSKLEYMEDFIPDIIIIDYADILAPEDKKLMGRERLDETWKMLKNLSEERHCLVVTASQSTRASIDKRTVTQKDTAEDIRKLAHVDGMISLNQTRAEKRRGIMRIGVIASRDRDFDEMKHCMVLQQIEIGQPHLDSEILYKRSTKEEDFSEEKI